MVEKNRSKTVFFNHHESVTAWLIQVNRYATKPQQYVYGFKRPWLRKMGCSMINFNAHCFQEFQGRRGNNVMNSVFWKVGAFKTDRGLLRLKQ